MTFTATRTRPETSVSNIRIEAAPALKKSDPALWDSQQIWGRPSDKEDTSCAPGQPRYKTYKVILDTKNRPDLVRWIKDNIEFAQAGRNWAVIKGREIRAIYKKTKQDARAICDAHGLSDKVFKEAHDAMMPKDKKGRILNQGNGDIMELLWTEASSGEEYDRWAHCIKHVSNEAIKSESRSWKQCIKGAGGEPHLRKLAEGGAIVAVRSSEVAGARKRNPEQEAKTKGFKLTSGRNKSGRYCKDRYLTIPKMCEAGFAPIRLARSLPADVCYDIIKIIELSIDRRGRLFAHFVCQSGAYPERSQPEAGTGIDFGAVILAYASNEVTGETQQFPILTDEQRRNREEQERKDRRDLTKLNRKLARYRRNQIEQHRKGNLTYPHGTKFDEHGNVACYKDGTPKIALGRQGKKFKEAIAKIHERVANRRREDRELLSRRIVANADMIVIEYLKPKNMMSRKPGSGKRGRAANRKMAGGTMGANRDRTVQKAHETGLPVVMLPGNAPSSKTCNRCHNVNPHARLRNSRDFRCWQCQHQDNSDRNAALNISAASRRAASHVVAPAPDKNPKRGKLPACDFPRKRRPPLAGSRGGRLPMLKAMR